MATVAANIGQTVELSAAFTNLAGVPKDPTAVTLQIKDPTGTVVTPAPTPTHDGAADSGLYHYDLPITASGVWRYRFAGTGAVVAAEEAKVFARSSSFS